MENYINRELSWLEFNYRVLQESKQKDTPLFEKLKFAAIASSNLDEFFMIRVASIKELIYADYRGTDLTGMTPKEQMKQISIRNHEIVEVQYNHYNKSLLQSLKKAGISILGAQKLKESELEEIETYFHNYLFPILTPMAVDSSRPFPLILSKSLNIGVLLSDGKFATVQVPTNVPRLYELKSEGSERRFVLLEDIICLFVDALFEGRQIKSIAPYRITRNADISIAEEDAADLLKEIEESLKQRKWGDAIRLEIDKKANPKLIEMLKDFLEIHKRDIYLIDGPLDLTFLFKLYSYPGYDQYKFKPYKAKTFAYEGSIFDWLKREDIFLHHPYDDFDLVVKFIEEAAKDPEVLAIKQTLYRVSGDSPIINALVKAAEKGKQVTAIVELKARFDEENNIKWAKRLERAGCHVIYGLIGLKVHSKITLVVRKEANGISRYVHLGTGNYNDVTAKIYTDMSLMTNDVKIGEDASKFFNTLSGYSEPPRLNKLYMAPLTLKQKLVELIRREIQHAEQGKKARIILKSNAMVDQELIDLLYEASQKGVIIQMIIRGICCLKPGLAGMSENIRVISIVGKYLEHNRTYYFYNDGLEEIYLSSADLMPRNLYKRVELLFPIQQENIREQIKGILECQLKDNIKGREMTSDGKYTWIDKRGKEKTNAQEILSTYSEIENQVAKKLVFIPSKSPQEEM